jgi:hypothetical protein
MLRSMLSLGRTYITLAGLGSQQTAWVNKGVEALAGYALCDEIALYILVTAFRTSLRRLFVPNRLKARFPRGLSAVRDDSHYCNSFA